MICQRNEARIEVCLRISKKRRNKYKRLSKSIRNNETHHRSEDKEINLETRRINLILVLTSKLIQTMYLHLFANQSLSISLSQSVKRMNLRLMV